MGRAGTLVGEGGGFCKFASSGGGEFFLMGDLRIYFSRKLYFRICNIHSFCLIFINMHFSINPIACKLLSYFLISYCLLIYFLTCFQRSNMKKLWKVWESVKCFNIKQMWFLLIIRIHNVIHTVHNFIIIKWRWYINKN